MCLAQGHNAVTPVRLKPEAPRSPVKHSTTEPLRSLYVCLVCMYVCMYDGLVRLELGGGEFDGVEKCQFSR